ncbi:MAG: MarR family winged helix-turn-helix transcriptional regulator [Candidatus Saccharimonadales bacterium]
MDTTEPIGALFGHVASILRRQADQVLQEQLGIGLSQLAILAALEKQPKTSQRKLSAILGQTEASISRQTVLLSAKGFISVQTDPAERRRHLVHALPKGSKVARAAAELLQQFYASVFGSLQARGQDQLRDFLATLHQQTCASGNRLSCDLAIRDD